MTRQAVVNALQRHGTPNITCSSPTHHCRYVNVLRPCSHASWDGCLCSVLHKVAAVYGAINDLDFALSDRTNGQIGAEVELGSM